MELIALLTAVEDEIENYVYEIHPEAIGQPLPQEWVDAQLAAMRAALVQPVWRDIRIQDSYEQVNRHGQGGGERRICGKHCPGH